MTAAAADRRLAGQLTVALPPVESFRLFTPRGEVAWAKDWHPHFPRPVGGDDSAPGTVFETHSHGRAATWVVVEREWGRRIRYARVIPGGDAGTVTVTLAAADAGTEVTVTYELTALSDADRRHLDGFADRYPAFLRSWEEAIAAALQTGT